MPIVVLIMKVTIRWLERNRSDTVIKICVIFIGFNHR